MTDEEWDFNDESRFGQRVLCNQSFCKHHEEKEVRIINISSMYGLVGNTAQTPWLIMHPKAAW